MTSTAGVLPLAFLMVTYFSRDGWIVAAMADFTVSTGSLVGTKYLSGICLLARNVLPPTVRRDTPLIPRYCSAVRAFLPTKVMIAPSLSGIVLTFVMLCE